MSLLFFGIGVMVGGVIGIFTMCMFTISGRESTREEYEQKRP